MVSSDDGEEDSEPEDREAMKMSLIDDSAGDTYSRN